MRDIISRITSWVKKTVNRIQHDLIPQERISIFFLEERLWPLGTKICTLCREDFVDPSFYDQLADHAQEDILNEKERDAVRASYFELFESGHKYSMYFRCQLLNQWYRFEVDLGHEAIKEMIFGELCMSKKRDIVLQKV